MRIAILALVLTVAAVLVNAQSTSAPMYQPTEIQSLLLQAKQQDARIAFEQYKQSLGILMNVADKVRAENKWPETVKFNPDTMAFAVPGSIPAKEAK